MPAAGPPGPWRAMAPAYGDTSSSLPALPERYAFPTNQVGGSVPDPWVNRLRDCCESRGCGRRALGRPSIWKHTRRPRPGRGATSAQSRCQSSSGAAHRRSRDPAAGRRRSSSAEDANTAQAGVAVLDWRGKTDARGASRYSTDATSTFSSSAMPAQYGSFILDVAQHHHHRRESRTAPGAFSGSEAGR